MQERVHIHTVVDRSTYRKLQMYGNGTLNDGIQKCIEIAEGKEMNVKIILEQIAQKVINEYAEK